jgi:hypothetical protein
MKKLISIIGLFTFVLFSIAAFAHDGAHGMKGTVTAISESTITIETPKKETQTIHFDADTKFQKSGAEASIKDLKVGDRVVIQAHDKEGQMHAVQVRFGKPMKAKAHAGHSDKAASEKR